MNLRQLRYFMGVIDAGNMTRAARQLSVAQTALGAQIKQLEEDLGVALLSRHPRGVSPTKSGTLLYERAAEIFRLVEKTRAEVIACERPDVEIVRFGITPALMLAVGTDLALLVRRRLPDVSFSMIEAMSHILAPMLASDEVDFILCYDVPDHHNIDRIELLEDDLVFVQHPDLCSGDTIAFDDAVAHELAMPEEGDSIRSRVTRLARERGAAIRVAHEVRSISAMKQLVELKAAAAILPYASVIQEARDGRLGARRIHSPVISRGLYLASSRKSAGLRSRAALTAVVRESLRGFGEALGDLCRITPGPAEKTSDPL